MIQKTRGYLFWILFVGLIVPMGLYEVGELYTAEWTGISIAIHSVFEALGFFASIMLALLLLQIKEKKKNTPFYVLVSAALIAMGILDGFHAFSNPGNQFVWLHSVAMLAGSVLFVMIIIPFSAKTFQPVWHFPLLIGLLSVAIGIFSMSIPDLIPTMIENSTFTNKANAINIFSGVLFIITASYLMVRLWYKKSTLEMLLAIFTLLLGISGLIFSLGEIWTFDWWMWHILRLIAYLSILGYVMYVFYKTMKLNELVTIKLKKRTSDLNNLLVDVNNTVEVLVSSSVQILSATTQVASGTAETATAISQTTSTVVEVLQAAKLSAQKAENVSNNAKKVVQESGEGNRAVDDTIQGIGEISQQMDSIAKLIVLLNEQSQSIGGIISSVTDIAEQSNILAVNASIEAAKAGEHGRGFTVVAEEIRNLAGQSKQSTIKIRDILNDIQKATRSAVLATRQGSDVVENGVKRATRAGEAIKNLSQTTKLAMEAASQILASSEQQVIGMDQIGLSMQNIYQAGAESAASMAQTEKAAKELNDMGQKLKDLLDTYKKKDLDDLITD